MKQKNIKKWILIGVILFFLVVVFVSFFSANGNDSSFNEKTNETIKQEKWITPNGSNGKIYVYSNGDVIEAINENNESYIKNDNSFKVISSYDCNLSNCNTYGVYKNKNYIIVKDYYYYIFDYKKNKALKLNFPDAVYNSISFLGYEDNVYGLSVSNINDLYAYYSLKQEKFITEFKYNMINSYENPSFVNERFIASVYAEKKEKYYIVDTITGKELWESDMFINAFGNENYIYYLKEYGDAFVSNAQIYNDKYKLINDKKYRMYASSKDGNLAVLNENNTFSLYNKNGDLIKNSKTYKNIGNIFNDYVVVVDNDDYLKLIDYDGNVLAKFLKLQEKYIFYPELSYIKYDDGNNIIYLCVENLNIEYGQKGNGLLYYYSINTKQKGVIEINSVR